MRKFIVVLFLFAMVLPLFGHAGGHSSASASSVKPAVRNRDATVSQT